MVVNANLETRRNSVSSQCSSSVNNLRNSVSSPCNNSVNNLRNNLRNNSANNLHNNSVSSPRSSSNIISRPRQGHRGNNHLPTINGLCSNSARAPALNTPLPSSIKKSIISKA